MSNGGAAGEGHPGPAGTEYTLQGVMRFLQIEWHNHERARNAWDIERAEMKAKIAKQEGECRSAKKLNDQLDRQIRMLELALKNERAKNKGLAVREEGKELKGKASTDSKLSGQEKPKVKHHNSFLDTGSEPQHFTEEEKEAQRDKSKAYLQKCVDEITYLLMPPTLLAPPQNNLPSLSNSSAFFNQGDGAVPYLEEQYMQQRLKSQQNQGPLSNHQFPSAHSVPGNGNHVNHQPVQPPFMSRELPSQQNHQQQNHQQQNHQQQNYQQQTNLFPADDLPQQGFPSDTSGFPSMPEEQVEKITHSYDSFGQPIAPKEDEPTSQPMVREHGSVDPDAWNFDDTNAMSDASLDAPRRPDTDLFPSANNIPAKSPPRTGPGSHRRRSSGASSMARRRSEEAKEAAGQAAKADAQNFKVRFALRGHMDVVRSVIFTGGGSPAEPEICTAGDDGLIKRWIIPASYSNFSQHSSGNDLDIQSYFTHRGHDGIVTSLAACPASASFSTGGRVSGDGWIFSGGQDATVRVWERGRVDPKVTLDGHTDAVWSVCVLPATSGAVFGSDSSNFGEPDRILLASGSADGTVKIWAISAPPQLASPQTGSRRGVGGARRHSVTSGSNFPSSPQPSVATATPIHYTLIHSIERTGLPSPTCISPLSMTGETFVVSYSDSSILIFDTRTGEEIIGMASAETYDGTLATSINSVVATSVGLEGSMSIDSGRGISEDENVVHGATGSSGGGGVEGVIISGHEDQFIRFFDANSGQCTYSMLAHPSAISSLSLSKDGREAVSAGHDASIRFWSLEKRICTQEITSHRIMRGEGVCSVVWSQDGRLVVSAGGDGVVKVFAR